MRKCRESIREHGLLPNRPTSHRPYGVYVFRDDGGLNHECYHSITEWEWWPEAYTDCWQVAYIGPMMPDEYVINGMILLGTKIDFVSLVTGN